MFLECLALRTDATYVGRRSRALGAVYGHLTPLMASAVSWGKEPTTLFVSGWLQEEMSGYVTRK